MFCHLTHRESGPRAGHVAAEPEKAFLAGCVGPESLHERTPLEAEQVEQVRTASPRVLRATDECKPNRYSRKRLICEDDAAQLDVGCENGASDWFAADRGQGFIYGAGDASGFTAVHDSPNQKVPGWSPDSYSPAGISVDAPEGGGAREMLNEYEIAARAHYRPSESSIRQMDKKDRDGIEIHDGSFGYRTAMSEASLYNVSKDRSFNEGLSPTDTALEMCSYDPHIQPVVASKPVVLQSPLEFIAGRCSPTAHANEQGTTTMTGIDKNTRLDVADYLEQQYIKTMNQTKHLPARNIGHKLAYNGTAERQNYRSVQDDPFQCERDIGGRRSVFGRDVAARNEQSVFGRDVAPRNEQSVFGRDVAARNEQSVFGRDVAARNEQSVFGRDVAARNEQSVFGRDVAARNEQSVFGRDVAARNEQSVFGRDVAARNEQSVFGRDVAARNEQSVFSRDVAARNEQSVFGRDVAARNEQSVFPMSIAKTEFPSEISTKSEAADGKRYARVVRGEATEVPVCGEYRNYDDAHRVKLWTEFCDVCDGSTGRRVATAERHSASLVQPVRRNDRMAERGQTHNEMVPGFGEQQPRLRHPSPVAVVVGRSSPWYTTPTGARAAMTPSNTGHPLHSSGEVAKTPGRRSSTPNRTPNIAPVTPCVRRPVQAPVLGETGVGTERTRETTVSRGKKMGHIWPILIVFVSSCM